MWSSVVSFIFACLNELLNEPLVLPLEITRRASLVSGGVSLGLVFFVQQSMRSVSNWILVKRLLLRSVLITGSESNSSMGFRLFFVSGESAMAFASGRIRRCIPFDFDW